MILLPERSLRQINPLSPFIFILCTESLVNLINQRESQGKITEMCFTRACPSISHFLFAEYILFFYKAEPRKCEKVMKVVRKYRRASGQCVNSEKASLLLGKKVNENIRQEIKDTLEIQNKSGIDTYLGIPKDINRSK